MDDAQARDIATRAAFRAGRLAMARLGDPGYLTWKGHRDVVSGASLEVQGAVVANLQRECPGDAILVEEGPADEALAVDAARLWIVDPICGSLNFVHGIPFFAVSIALRVDGELRVGAVYDPMRDEAFSATRDGGATLNGRPIAIRTTSEGPEFWEQSWIGTDLPHSGPRRETALRVFGLYSGEVISQTIMGSPALGICYVACGRLHAYWNLDARPWDVAAAGVILEEAGGLMTDAEGGSWLHSEGGYVAGVPGLVRWAQRGIDAIRDQERPLTPRGWRPGGPPPA
ncbi:MAG: inositol monophosphatase family protein [Thermoleophilaceae bacterium]